MLVVFVSWEPFQCVRNTSSWKSFCCMFQVVILKEIKWNPQMKKRHFNIIYIYRQQTDSTVALCTLAWFISMWLRRLLSFVSKAPLAHLQEYSHCYDCKRGVTNGEQGYTLYKLFLSIICMCTLTLWSIYVIHICPLMLLWGVADYCPLVETYDTYHSWDICELHLRIFFVLY